MAILRPWVLRRRSCPARRGRPGCLFVRHMVPWDVGKSRGKNRCFGGTYENLLYFYGENRHFSESSTSTSPTAISMSRFFFLPPAVGVTHWHRGRTSTSCCVQKVPTISRPTSCARASQSSRAMSGTQDPKRYKVHRDEISCLTILESCTRLI